MTQGPASGSGGTCVDRVTSVILVCPCELALTKTITKEQSWLQVATTGCEPQ